MSLTENMACYASLRTSPQIFLLTYFCVRIQVKTNRKDNAMTACDVTSRDAIRAALERAGWQIDDERPDHITASDGERYGVAVFFETGRPVSIECGDGELDLQYREEWDAAPGVLAPEEVARLFHEETGE
jgi:hypothetical protein